MKVNRQKFLLHLSRLLCDGQATEVVFGGAFSSNALTPDQMLMVVAPDISGVEPLSEEIGVADVPTLISALKLLQGEGNIGVEVNVYVEDNRIVINDGDRGVQRLLIAAPRTIATRIEQETVDAILKDAPKDKSVALTRAIVDGVRGAFRLYKAEEIEIHVGPKGSKIVVGSERTHQAAFAVDAKSKEEYVLIFGRHLVDVFGVISDYSSAALRLGGPGKPILVEDGGFRYILSPRIRSADEVKAPVKSDSVEETEETKPKKKNSRKASTD